MMKGIKPLITGILFYSGSLVYGQTAVVSTGGTISGSGGSLSYSVGQVTDGSYTTSFGSSSEGVQQPYELFGDDNGVAYFELNELEILVYPNPAYDRITLALSEFQSELSYVISEMDGRYIQSSNIVSYQTDISLNDLAAGIYLVTISDKFGNSQTIKLIKR